MRRLASKFLTTGGRLSESKNRSAHDDLIAGSAGESVSERASARERLNGPGVLSFRIHSKDINFTSDSSHGSGGKADVAQAKFKRADGSDEQLVAVKRLRSIEAKKARNEFVNEVEVMAGLSHENIVELIGFVEDLEEGIAWIVLSWEPNGNLSDFLEKEDWEIPERVSLIQDTFQGLQYLHTRQPPICHGDLKSYNILVNSLRRAIISDLGSARAVTEPEEEVIGDESGEKVTRDQTTEPVDPPIHVGVAGNHLTLTGPAWTLRWAPPEVVKGKRPSLSSDIWAAGWVCWEVMTNKVPFYELNSENHVTLTVIRGKVPSPHDCGQLAPIGALCSLMADCWAFGPKDRPNISQCCRELKWMPSEPPLAGNPSGPRAPTIRLLLQMGQIEFRRASYENAASLFQQGLSLATSGGDQKWVAIALRLLGNAYRMQFKYSEAEGSYTRAQEIFGSTGDDSNLAMTLEGMGRLSIARYDYTRAENEYLQVQEIYNRLNDEHGQAIALRGLGQAYYLQSKYAEGEASYTRAREIFARVGDDNGEANALHGLGGVNYSQSKYSQAEKWYQKARELYVRGRNDVGIANTLNGLSKVYLLQSKHNQAEELANQAQEIYVRLGDDTGRSSTFDILGAIYSSQLKNPQAEAMYTRALEISERLGDDSGQANAANSLAKIYLRQSKYTQSEESYARAQDIYARQGDERSQAGALAGMADACRLQSKYTQAEELFTQSQALHARVGNEEGLATALLGLGDVSRNQTKYAQAEEFYIRALEICTRLGDDTGRVNLLWSMGHLCRSQARYEEAKTLYNEAKDLCTRLGRIKEAEPISELLALVLQEESSSKPSSVLPHIQSSSVSQ